MIVKTENYSSETIPALIQELREDAQLMRDLQSTDARGNLSISDYIEAIATHIIMTDTEFDAIHDQIDLDADYL